ncbi:hypothetical protein BH10PAT1_BH10PAT1_0550 [soil metagenome]
MTLYLKYRPQTLNELDLESVRDNLKNIVNSDNIPHAFLFSGPKGTGKTSAARILAKIINCENLQKDNEPCNKCTTCISITKGNNIDIIELDAASNRGIDDIRNLKEGIYLAPASAKKKVYIIDEAHMLTTEAANAFLKTLEEPPDHVVFILATTNPEKLPETVVSRLTRVDFTKATAKDISRQLNRVAKGEEIKIDEQAIEKISKIADGSFRDAVKILESLITKNKSLPAGRQDIKEIDIDTLFPNLASNITDFFVILKDKDAKKSLEFIENQITNGVSIKNFIEEIFTNIHQSILAKNNLGEDLLPNFSLEDLINLNELLIVAKSEISPIHQLPLEIAVVKFCLPAEAPAKEDETEKETIETKVEGKKEEIKKPVKKYSSLDSEVWQKLLVNTHQKNVGVEALLRTGKPLGFDGKVLTVGIYYQFHKERLEDTKNVLLVEDICKGTFGADIIKIDYELIEKEKTANDKPQSSNDVQPLTTSNDKDIIDAAKEIFG